MHMLTQQIARELTVRPEQVQAAVDLLDGGATVPFIARYRKEVTQGLDDTQLRNLQERLLYLRELEDRRAAILGSISEQGKLTDDLKRKIQDADTKSVLEDLYLPYKPKRTTKGQLAIAAGILPLADNLLADPMKSPEELAAGFVCEGYADTKAVLEGAKYILMERFAEDADLLGKVRPWFQKESHLFSKVVEGKEEAGAKFRDYFECHENILDLPSHRALAMFRGRNEGILSIGANLPDIEPGTSHPGEGMVAGHNSISDQGRPADKWLQEVVRWTWRIKLHPHLESGLLTELKQKADEEAIRVFGQNLKSLLMAAPAGQRATLGLDPGLRTGVKVAVVDHTGKLVAHTAIFPHEPRRDWDGSLAALAKLCAAHNVELIAIGNGTASRETDKLAGELIKKHPELNMTKIVVSEAGASVYSASALAAEEFPDIDVSYRGAASIARRLQDPLAELVKIDPKAIGVGQYQHDVNQAHLVRALEGVVEDCVNAVGVDANTASVALLTHIAGLNKTIAQNLVNFRNENGAFRSRDDLKKVPRLGAKTFEQAAGFLRVPKGDNPLDASGVHPEAYPVVEKILRAKALSLKELMGNGEKLRSVKPTEFTDERFGLPTVQDILQELEKPGRDPRPAFVAPQFLDGVTEIKDLKEGMVLEGVVTNVTNFGAFVDIGVHQDGLVHISMLADTFVKDPHTVVKAGDIVKVKVLEVDVARKRIALSRRLNDKPAPAGAGGKPEARPQGQGRGGSSSSQGQKAPAKIQGSAPVKGGTLGDLLLKAGMKK
ncbi:MAG: Tex family protein [Fluviicoccus sp.]|uniref:Tex family protein n=1 Tax=Fluviicoccus sp. TaxID=2003552 RepID=UPI00271DC2E6|nr:Tex family protein [Fluviicoccus sp.]MDO8330903.1 Tex family protein [Fluviicoccus sp.]